MQTIRRDEGDVRDSGALGVDAVLDFDASPRVNGDVAEPLGDNDLALDMMEGLGTAVPITVGKVPEAVAAASPVHRRQIRRRAVLEDASQV